jgi:hypothetical protein
VLLGVLAAPELERDHDLGDAAEQREEPDPVGARNVIRVV